MQAKAAGDFTWCTGQAHACSSGSIDAVLCPGNGQPVAVKSPLGVGWATVRTQSTAGTHGLAAFATSDSNGVPQAWLSRAHECPQ